MLPLQTQYAEKHLALSKTKTTAAVNMDLLNPPNISQKAKIFLFCLFCFKLVYAVATVQLCNIIATIVTALT